MRGASKVSDLLGFKVSDKVNWRMLICSHTTHLGTHQKLSSTCILHVPSASPEALPDPHPEALEEATNGIYRDLTVDNSFHISGFLVGKAIPGSVISECHN